MTEAKAQSEDKGEGEESDDTREAGTSEQEQVSAPASSDKLDESRLRYENGKCYYTDPKTGRQLEWDEAKQEWKNTEEDPTDKCYKFKNGTYYYTLVKTGTKYKWHTDKNEWELCPEGENDESDDDEEEMDEDGGSRPKEKEVVRQDMSKGVYSTEDGTHIYTDPTDGTVYEWDVEKNAWFPKIDDDFLAHYQMNYGFVKPDDNAKPVETEPVKPSQDPKKDVGPVDPALKRKAPDPPTWFDVSDESNTKVYVSNLPLDVTEQEFVDLMQKCGLVMKDVETGKMKVKLYTEPGTDHLKGDALCTYIKIESVQLALNLLDGYDYRGKKIRVERAKFTMKGGAYDPSLKPKKKRRKDKDKIKKMQAKLFDWRPEKMRGQRSKNESIVILKNLFDPTIFDRDPGLILEYKQDLREECVKCGDLKKITIFDRHAEGVAQINFKEAEAADACIQLMNGRWFGQRQLKAEAWDGKTKYKIIETDAEIEDRIKNWDKFLGNEEDKDVKGEKKNSEEGERSEVEKADETQSQRPPADDSDNETRSSGSTDDEVEKEKNE